MTTAIDFSPYDDHIVCTCGNSMDIEGFKSNLTDELNPKFLTSIEDETPLACDNCNRTYHLELAASLEISYNFWSLTSTGIDYYDKDNNLVLDSFFEDMITGDSYNLWDGEYIVGDKCYRILDGKLLYILSALTDNNQINIFELEGASI